MPSRRPLRLIALSLALTTGPARLVAQADTLRAAVGQRIRATFLVSADGRPASTSFRDRTRRLTGSLARLDGDTLFLAGQRRSGETAIPRSGLRRLEISSGRRTRTGHGAALGALIGFGAGAVSGVVICQIISSCDASGSDSLIEGELTVAVAGILGLGGALAGTGIGAIAGSFAHTDRWRPIRLGALGGPRPAGDGIRLGLSIRF